MRILRELGYVENQILMLFIGLLGATRIDCPLLLKDWFNSHPQIATDGCGQRGDDRSSDCALPYRVRPRSIILGVRSARFANGRAAEMRGQRYLQESPTQFEGGLS
jgi:hypothetical protein